MSFDITKYCTVLDIVEKNAGDETEYSGGEIALFFVKEGRAQVFCADKHLTAEKGDVFCCGEKCRIITEPDSRIVGLYIGGIIAEKYAKEVDGVFAAAGMYAPFLSGQIVQVAENFENLSEIYISNTAFEIINTLSHSGKKAVIGSQLIVQAIKLIRENYRQVYGVEELAMALDISKSHLVREFCKHTGTTPGKYITSVRIDAVKQMLTGTSWSLSAIAQKTGFSGDNYLCKAFKKVTGETPMAYKSRVISSQYLPNQLTFED